MARYNLSLSTEYSPELLALYRVKGFGLHGKIKDALRAYVAGEPYIIDIPEDLCKGEEKGRRLVQLTFSEKKDEKVIAFLDSIPKGGRSTVIKQIVEAYFSRNINYLFYKQPDGAGRRVVLAAGEESYKAAEPKVADTKAYVKEKAEHVDSGNEPKVKEDMDQIEDITEPVTGSAFDLFAASESLMGEM